MKAVIIAAGQGTRLRPYTEDRPKCMVKVKGKPILHHQIDALAQSGIDEIVVIRGYKGRAIDAPGVRFVDNRDYANNNILVSLFSAGAELAGDVIVSYGDIVYHPSVLATLVDTPGPCTLVIDEAWKKIYEGRTDHPVDQAELCTVSNFGLVTEVGKHVGAADAFGEFIGLARFSAAFTARMWATYLTAKSQGMNTPYGKARSLKMAYLSDLLNTAIEDGEPVGVLATEGGWREIDTVQDLERAADGIDW